MKKYFVIFLLITTFSTSATEPQQIVEDIFASAKDGNISRNLALQEKINNYIAFDEMALNILGSDKKNLSAENIHWFQITIKKIITLSVYPKAPDFLKNVKISYETANQKGNKTTIESIVKKKGEETEVSYSLKKDKNEWKVVDISIDGESWVESITEQVHSVLVKEKWVKLEEKLSKKLKDLQTEKK
jgi:ABC-type transporter MlaC component